MTGELGGGGGGAGESDRLVDTCISKDSQWFARS